MPNSWGTQLPAGQLFFPGSLVSTTVPAGVETNIVSIVMAGTGPGVWTPSIFGFFYFQIGATPPSQVLINGRIGAGADFQSVAVTAGLLTANANFPYWFMLSGTPSDVPWRGAGSTVFVSITSTGQALTLSNSGMYLQATLLRAPDQ